MATETGAMESIVEFILELDRLKGVTRKTTSAGSRPLRELRRAQLADRAARGLAGPPCSPACGRRVGARPRPGDPHAAGARRRRDRHRRHDDLRRSAAGTSARRRSSQRRGGSSACSPGRRAPASSRSGRSSRRAPPPKRASPTPSTARCRCCSIWRTAARAGGRTASATSASSAASPPRSATAVRRSGTTSRPVSTRSAGAAGSAPNEARRGIDSLRMRRLLPLAGAALALAFAWVVPLGESPDELAHLRYAEALASGRLPALWKGDADGYEAHQPPLGYVLPALVVAAAGGVDVAPVANARFDFHTPGSRAFLPPFADARDRLVLRLARSTQAVWVALTIWAGLTLAAERRTAAPFLLAPQLFFVCGAINNDGALIACVSCALVLLVRFAETGRHAIGIGLLVTAALFTKGSALFLLVPVVVAACLAPLRSPGSPGSNTCWTPDRSRRRGSRRAPFSSSSPRRGSLPGGRSTSSASATSCRRFRPPATSRPLPSCSASRDGSAASSGASGASSACSIRRCPGRSTSGSLRRARLSSSASAAWPGRSVWSSLPPCSPTPGWCWRTNSPSICRPRGATCCRRWLRSPPSAAPGWRRCPRGSSRSCDWGAVLVVLAAIATIALAYA